jgi:hypothetical protein
MLGGTRGAIADAAGRGDQSFLLMPKTLRSRGLSKDGDLTTTIFMCGTPFDGYSLTVYAAPSDWENGFWKK